MASPSVLITFFVLFTLHVGTCDATSDDHCRGGLSLDKRSCPLGCTFGFASADKLRAKLCRKDILKPGLNRCREPSSVKRTKVATYRQDFKCERCKKGWDGDYCTRENIAHKKVRGEYPVLQDENNRTCAFINGTEESVKLKIERNSASVVDLFLSPDMHQMASFKGCRLKNAKPCPQLASPHPGIIRLNCSEPSSQPKQLKIDCIDRVDPLHLCEVKVYACNAFWFGVEAGCPDPCHCQDGVNCNDITGACPPGKEIVQLTSASPPTFVSTASKHDLHLSSAPTPTPHRVTPVSAGALTNIDMSRPDTMVTHSTTLRMVKTDSVTSKPVAEDRLTTQSRTVDSRTSESYITDIYTPGTDSVEVIVKDTTATPDMTVRPTTASTTPPTLPVSDTQTELSPATISRDVSSALPVSLTTQPSTNTPESRVPSIRLTSQRPRSDTTLTMFESKGSQEGKKKAVLPGSAKAGSDDSGEGEAVMVPVLVGMSLLVLLASFIFAGIVIYRYRQKRGTKSEELLPHNGVAEPDPENNTAVVRMEMKTQNGAHHSSPTVSSTMEPAENVYSNVPDKFSATTEPVPVDAFRKHVSHLSSVGGFLKEFQMLPRGIQGPVLAAKAVNEGTVKKNRFRDISPYDSSRVTLTKEKEVDSDYINASYIDGFAEAMAYIAAQGPLPDTVEDFWHMVWVEGCDKIVMLTNLCEGGKIKCEQYWPQQEGSSITCGRYTITSIKVTERAHFTHRVLDITKNTGKSAVSEMHRQVHQFHFRAWTDHGVPCAVSLVHFWSTVMLQHSQLAGPLLVHCSAGIGRTGTFIALDILSHQAETTGKVSVFPTVQRLRKQRVNMVQTVSQYQFLHEVVVEWLASHDSYVVKDDLKHGSQWKVEGESDDQLPAAVRQKSASQFQLLDKLRPKVTTDQVTTAMLKENASKNRSTQILPVEQYRVCLRTSDNNPNDYINAVFLPSLSRQQGYIVTQLPLEDTVSDFWEMVADWRVKVIVRFMDAPIELDVQLFPEEGQQIQHGSVSIYTYNKSLLTPDVTCYTLHLHTQECGRQDNGDQATDRAVTVYLVQSPCALSLRNTATFLSLVNILLPLITADAQTPVLVQCFDGARLSCILCGLMMAVEALEEEDRVSPFLLTRLIQAARPQAFKTAEQYEFLVCCLLHHARGITDTDDIPECDQSSEMIDDPSHIYGNVQ